MIRPAPAASSGVTIVVASGVTSGSATTFSFTTASPPDTDFSPTTVAASSACTVSVPFPATVPTTSAATRTFTIFSFTYLLNLLI